MTPCLDSIDRFTTARRCPRKNRISTTLIAAMLVACVVGAAAASAAPPHDATAAASTKPCAKFSGPVLLTYAAPQTIIIHIIKGKVNAATVFTMTPTTAYTRNGQPATFADIKVGDTATICAVEQLPSGTLLASWVQATGP